MSAVDLPAQEVGRNVERIWASGSDSTRFEPSSFNCILQVAGVGAEPAAHAAAIFNVGQDVGFYRLARDEEDSRGLLL
jgi:hypothetical protein